MNNIIGSLDRGLRILEMLGTAAEPLGVTEIAGALKVDKSTAYRLLHTLQCRGYVHQVETRKYRLGYQCIRLGSLALKAIDLLTQARPFLEELADQTGQTVHLAVLSDGDPIYVDRIQGRSIITVSTNVGREALRHCTASGKAISAYLPPEQLHQIYDGRELPQYTPNTITDLASLEAHLQVVREQGYAVDDEERYQGVRCVGAPIFDHRGQVIASVSVSSPSSQMDLNRIKQIEELKGIVIKVATQLSARLGHTGERIE